MNTKNKSILPVAMAVASMLSMPAIAQETDANIPPDFDSKMATIQFMSYMNYVAYTLSSYRNPFVIEDEYRNLDDNLRLNRILDKECEDAIHSMLNTIESMRVEDKRRDHFFEGQARIAQQKRADLFLNIAKSAISSGTQATALGFQGVKGNAQAIVDLSKSIADECVGIYANWIDVQRRLEKESSDYKFEYDVDKDKKLHEQNAALWDMQIALTKKYELGDSFRLTKENAEALVNVVKSSDKKRAFKLMRQMKEREPAYDKFPMFWCYYASFALDYGDIKEALVACEHFKEINRHSLFKRDRMAALVAMTEISAIIKTKDIDADKVRFALDAIMAYNYHSKDIDMAYFCASTYYSVLGDAVQAKKTLEVLIAALEDAAYNSLTKYCDLFDSGEPEKPWESNPPPVMTDLFRCHALLRTISDSGEDDSFREDLKNILDSSTAASMEKLFFVGAVLVGSQEEGQVEVSRFV